MQCEPYNVIFLRLVLLFVILVHDRHINIVHRNYFSDSWTKYLMFRQISDGTSVPVFTREDEVEFRDELYTSWSFGGWAGASGHDSTMIA